MKLTADAKTAEWLAGRPAVQWDRGNRTKSMSKHGVTSAEVEELLDYPLLFAGRIVEPDHGEARFLLLGQTSEGRLLTLVFTRRGEVLRPISCRAMRKKEKELYAREVGN